MKHKDIMMIVIPSFILVLVWIGFTIYHNMISSTITANVGMQIKPINPNFDSTTISDLKTRKKIQPVYELMVSTPTPAPEINTSFEEGDSATQGGAQSP